MDPSKIQQTIQLWQAEPGKAQARPTVKAWSDGSQAVIEAGPFSWRADLPASLGGNNQAPSPVALLLGALAGCAVAILRDTLAPQLGVQLDEVQAVVQCDCDFRGLLAMDGVAPDLQNVQVVITARSPDSEANVKRLYQAWLERCPIYLALIGPTPVKTSLEFQAG